MKSLIKLHTLVAHDMGNLLGVDPVHDVAYMERRHSAEGDSFLTITLPQFEAAFLACLSSGRIDLTAFPGFRSRGRLPLFLRGFVSLVFSDNGELRLDADAEAVRAVRQICSCTKKLERDVSPSRVARAYAAYAETDEALPVEDDVPDHLRRSFRRWAERLFGRILDRLEASIASYDLVPRHGPGSVAEGFSPKRKWDFDEWYQSIDEVFPSNFYTSYNVNEGFRTCISREGEKPVRVITVPKTMKTPRIIAIEPAARQYVQQAVSRFLYQELRDEYPDELDLLDQGTNRAWAMVGSVDQSISTLDLSEASDRVSLWLVELLIGRRPHVLDALRAARSPLAELPSGVIALKKFASMGSALTFPVQSMVFYTIIRMSGRSQLRQRGLTHTAVFGDDMIVPSDITSAVVDNLEVFGLKVNKSKSYLEGNFRESCGEEYFFGHDVSIVKLRRDLPVSRRDAQKLGSVVAFRNDCYRRGMWQTCSWLDQKIGTIIRFLPIQEGWDGLGRLTYLPVKEERISPTLQYGQVRRPVLAPKQREYKVDGPAGLLKWFLEKRSSNVPTGQWSPTERPIAFTINNRWIAVT